MTVRGSGAGEVADLRPSPLAPRRAAWRALVGRGDLALWGELAGLLAGWRLALLLFAALAVQLDPKGAPVAGAAGFLARILNQWDAGWYLAIARDGYSIAAEGQSNVAFYPLLPLLIRAVHLVVPSWHGAGAIAVHGALFGALVYLHRLARLDYDRATATRAAIALLLCPTAIFLGVVYTEPLLLLTMIASVYHARRGQWWIAGLWGAAAGLTKMVGAVVVVPLLWEYWRSGVWRREPGRGIAWRRVARTLPATALPPLGALAFLAWLGLRFGSYRVYFAAQEGWYRGSFFRPFFPDGWNFLTASLRHEGDSVVNYFYPQGNTFPSTGTFMILDLLFLFVFAAIGVALCLRVRGSYGLFVLAVLGLAAFSGSPQSINRFAVILFPAFIGFALAARRPVVGFGLLTLGGLLLAFHTFLFVNGFWAG